MNRSTPRSHGEIVRCVEGFFIILVCLFGTKATGTPGDIKWQRQLGTCIMGAPTLTTTGNILVGSDDGTLYCLTTSGSNIWSYSTSTSIVGVPAVAEDGTIYFGSDKLYALNADGSKRWEFVLETYSSYFIYAAAPAIGPDGAVYVARPFAPGSEGRLYAVNPDGTLRWKLDGDFVHEPIVGTDGSVLAPTDGAFACVNPDGTIRWQYAFGSEVMAPAAVLANGTAIVPVNGGTIYDGALQATTPSGSNIWRFAGNAQTVSSPIIGPDGRIYYGFDNGRIVALGSDGDVHWEYLMPGPGATGRIGSTPALAADGTLYFPGDHSLYALGPTGSLRWQFDCGTNEMGSPLIGPDGTIYVGDNRGFLYALKGNGAGLAAGQWPMSRRNAKHQASGAGMLEVPPPPAGITASFTNYTDKVLITWTSAPPASYYVVSRSQTTNFDDAQLLATNITGTTTYEDRSAEAEVTYYYFVQSRNAAGTSSPCGPVEGMRRAAAVGEVVWAFPAGGSVSTPALAPDGTLLSGSSDGNLYAANADGSLKWSFNFGGASCSAPSVDSDGSVYFSAAISRYPATVTNAIFALNANGQLRWRLLDVGQPTGLAIRADGSVVVASGDYSSPDLRYVKAISPSGSVLWTFANGRNFMATPCIAANGTVYATTTKGYLEALRSDGTLLWECNTGDSYLKTPVINSNGVLFTAGGSFHAINTDGQPIWSAALQYGADAGPSCIGSTGVLYAQADYAYYRFNANGSNLQKLSVPEQMNTLKPVLRDSDGTVYIIAYSGSSAGKIFAISDEGTVLWDYDRNVGFGEAVLGANHALYVPGSDGKLYAFRTAAGPDNSAWPQPLHDPQHTARAVQMPAAPAAPTHITATTRTRVTDVRLAWSSSLRAVHYDLYRSSTTNIAEATLLASRTGTLIYDDNSAVPERAYTYWVKARNASGSSPFSAPVIGVRRQPLDGELLYEWNLYGAIDTSPAITQDGTVYVSVNYPVNGSPDAGRKVVAVKPDGTIRWQYLTGQAMLTSPSIGTNGTIYVGTRGALNRFPYPSPLLALNPDGTLRWQIMADDAIETTPAIARDGTVYAGSTLGTLYAISPDGRILWTNRVDGSIATPAVGRDGTIYFIQGGTRLTAVRPDGRVLWSVPGAGLTSFGDGPLPGVALESDGAIVVSCGGQGLKAFNADGTLRWQQTEGNPFYTPPTIGAGGCILVGNYAQSSGSTVWCFNSEGTNVWNAAGGGSHVGAAAVAADGTALISGYGSRLSAFSSTGSNLWQLALGTASLSSPAIAPDGTIFIGGEDGKLRSVFGTSPLADTAWPMFQHDARHTGRDVHAPVLPDAATGIRATDGAYNNLVRLTWTTAAAAGWYEVWRSTTTNASAAVCLATNVAGATRFDDKTAVPGTLYYYWVKSLNNLGASPLAGPDSGYRRVAVPGELLGDSLPIPAAGTSPTVGNNGDIYVGTASYYVHALYALTPDLTNGWEFTQGQVSTPMVGDDGQIYFWSSDGRFYALDPDGTPVWSFPGRYNLSLPAAVAADGAVIIADANQTVSCFDPATQSLRWQYNAGSPITAAPAIGVDGAVYFGCKDGQLRALNANGTLRWRFRTGGRIQSSPVVSSDGVVYFGSDDRGIYAVQPDGKLLWAAQAGDVVRASPVIAPDGTVIVGSQDGQLYAFSAKGTELWKFAASGAIYASACVGSDGMIYFGTYNGWVQALNRAGQLVWSVNSATNGLSGRVMAAPLLLHDRLLVPINSAGLEALAVSAGPATVNWPQYRHDAQRTARARTWLTLALPDAPGRVAGEALSVTARLAFAGHTVTRLELLCSTNVLAVANGPGPSITWSPVAEGDYFLYVRAVDDAGNVHTSAPFRVKIAPQPELRMARSSSTGTRLIFSTVPGRSYQVERSDDLRSWHTVTEVTATGSVQVWTDSFSTGGAIFYRVNLLP